MILRKLLLMFFLCSALVWSYYSGLWSYLTFDSYIANRDLLLSKVNENYAVSSLLFVLIYISVTALSIPGAAILTLTGGYIFGYTGIIHVNMGATAGAAAAFLVSRYIAGEALQKKYAERLTGLNNEIEKNGKNYLLMLRFIFIFPFFLLNILAGLTRIPLSTFIWTTSLGILPGSLAYIYAGKQLKNITSPGDIVSLDMMMAFLLLTAVAVIPVLLKKIRGLKDNA